MLYIVFLTAVKSLVIHGMANGVNSVRIYVNIWSVGAFDVNSINTAVENISIPKVNDPSWQLVPTLNCTDSWIEAFCRLRIVQNVISLDSRHIFNPLPKSYELACKIFVL